METVLSTISALAAAISAIIAAFELHRSKKLQKEFNERERKQATISAFELLQEKALTNLVTFKKKDSEVIVDNLNDSKMKEAYDDCRALIAYCEHFAVGVNEGIYDFGTADKLGGLHLIFLYKNVEPIITQARKRTNNECPYCEFEKLATRLKECHPNT